MVNMLIANKDISKLKELINDMTANKSIRIAQVATEGEETLTALNGDNIDVALIDLNLPNITGIDILKKLTEEENEKPKYKDSIMIIAEDIEMAQNIVGNKMIYDYILEGTNKNEMMYKIDRMIQEKDLEENRKKIIKELKYLGYNIEYVGTNYLAETILQMYINRELMLENLQQEIYPLVSKVYNKSVHNIKCNINRATDCMYYECDSARLKEYFGFYDDTKPTAKTVMFTVLNKINF